MEKLKFDKGENYIYFGDGTTSLIALKNKFQDEDGVSKWRFLLWPSKYQKALYNLEEDDMYDADEGVIRKEFTARDVHVIDENPGRTRIWVFPSFNNEPTDISQRDEHRNIMIDYFEKEIKSLKTQVAKLQEDLKMERENELEAMEQKVALVLSAKKGGGHVKDSDEEPEDSMGS